MTPRLRFAPSPTGYLHVGGARTALFNWLYARRHGGTFVLRIEDTDVERSSADMVTGILDGLRWLGLDWDEGPEVGGPHAPYFQTAAARSLSRRGRRARRRRATRTTATARPNELEARRDARRGARRGVAVRPHVPRRCQPTRSREREAAGTPRAIRFHVPRRRDGVRRCRARPIEFDSANIEDFVILRSDGYPTYHLSVVVDDVEMGITHVVRGDDHISNTPKHVLLYQALGAPVPRVRARAADSRAGQEAPEQAPRRDVGDASTSGRAICPKRW